MGNLRQSMTDEEWDKLSNSPTKTEKQSFMKYTIDTQSKTIIVEQCSVHELTDLLTKLKQVHSDIHIYDIISKTITLEKTNPWTPSPIPNPYVAPIVPYTQPMRYEDLFQTYCTTTSGTKHVESKL